MTDKPILFSKPMVLALLAGTKTQTRRTIPAKMQDAYYEYDDWCSNVSAGVPTSRQWEREFFLERLRIHPGDRLYVRETYSGPYQMGDIPPRDWLDTLPIWYWADGSPDNGDWTKPKPGIHMPRWASRLTLTVTDVRVERLQDISDEDAEAEGCPECEECHGVGWINSGPDGGWQCTAKGCGDAYRDQYAQLWNAINGAGAWEANPWVAAYTFTVERRNIDQ